MTAQGSVEEIAVTIAERPAGTPPDESILLDVRGLQTHFHVMDGTVRAVDGVSFSVPRGGTVGLVGESACGKSVTALTIMRLLDIPPAEIVGGEVWFDGTEVLALPEDEMRHLRGNDMAMIFQEPLTSLNPVFTVGDQIAEQVRLHMKVDKKEAWDRAIESLRLVGIPSPEQRVKQYPHEMSGGMRQRVMIAMALSCEPKLLIADEPTTALDVVVQAAILRLLDDLRRERGMSLLLVSHDFGVVAGVCDRVGVMYAGELVELGPTREVLRAPRHPYTRGLVDSLPEAGEGDRMTSIPGTPPEPGSLPPGCPFAPRCELASPECTAGPIPLRDVAPGRVARCLHADLVRPPAAVLRTRAAALPAGGIGAVGGTHQAIAATPRPETTTDG